MSEDYPIDVPRSDEEMEVRQALVDRVEGDPMLTGDEAGTTINIYGTDKYYSIESERPTIVRSILAHEYAAIDRVCGVSNDDYDCFGVDDADHLDTVYSVSARMPVGTLTIKGTSRSGHTQSSIINTPSDVEGLREAFDNE